MKRYYFYSIKMKKEKNKRNVRYMLQKLFHYCILLLFAMVITKCAVFTKYGKLEKSARKNYMNKNYDIAFEQCMSSLIMNPNYGKAQHLIQDIFKAVKMHHEQAVLQYKRSTGSYRWDDVVNEYKHLIRMNKQIKSLPQLIDKKTKQQIPFELTDYADSLDAANSHAAETHYQAGKLLSVFKDLDSQKAAAKEFKKAQSFVSLYKDADILYEQCRKTGIKRIAIIPFINKSGKAKYGAIEDMITDDIIANVMNDPSSMEFLEIISREQLQQVLNEQQLGMSGTIDEKTAVNVGKILGVHELVTGKITQIIYSPAQTTSRTFQEEKKVPTHKEKYVDKGKVRERWVWSTVYANVTQYTKKAKASINGSYKIIDITINQ